MMHKRAKLSVLLSALCLVLWVVIFLAGTDVWHDTGRHDFWRLQGPPYHDLRILAVAFYVLFFVLIVQMSLTFLLVKKGVGEPVHS